MDPANILVLLLSLVVSCCGLIPFLIVMIFSLRALQLHFETHCRDQLLQWAAARQITVNVHKTLSPFRQIRLFETRTRLCSWDVTLTERNGQTRRGRMMAWRSIDIFQHPLRPHCLFTFKEMVEPIAPAPPDPRNDPLWDQDLDQRL